MRFANQSVALRVAEWTGRLLLVTIVTLWWGGHVVPQLFSLAFPALLPPDNLLHQLDPELDESFANALSAAILLTVALLAAANAIVGWRRGDGRVALGGWGVLAAIVAVIAISEISDTHNSPQVDVRQVVFGAETPPPEWARIALLSPLLAVFALAMGVFARHGLPAAPRVPFLLGIGAWLLAVTFDATQHLLLTDQDHVLGSIIEEMLEVSGALLIGLSAGITLRDDAASRSPPRLLASHWPLSLVGSMAVVVALGTLSVVFAFRVLLIDVRATPHLHTFELRLSAQESVMQELRMPADPIGRIDLRLAQPDPNGRAGTAAVRITSLEKPDRTLAVGSVRVPHGDRPLWRSVDLLPPLTQPEGQRLNVWVIAEIEPEAVLWVGVSKMSWYADGGFWINGAPGEPHHDLEFVAYGTSEPTRSKLRAVWDTFTSGWRWPVTLARMVVGLTLITFFPIVLVTAACRRPWARGGNDRR